jgi:membrane protease YdiL (CAAX protease family)
MRPFFIVLAAVWVALTIASLVLFRRNPHSFWLMSAALPAFLLEAFFYLGSVFESARVWLLRAGPPRTRAALLWFSALLPYCVFSGLAGTFERNAFYVLAGLTAVFSFWYAVLPLRPAYDIGFLVIAAAPIIERVFQRVYLSPDPHLRIEILGHLMWIRVGIAALFTERHWDPGPFGFWPRWREWRSGVLWFAICLIPIALVGLAIHDVRYEPVSGPWWRVLGIGIGTFFGILWVVALAEELFFRGIVERALLEFWRPAAPAIILSTLGFATAHLWFHHFPDWRRAVTAGVLGLACGISYWQTGSVRAPMVTHALVVATWRMFFR